MSIEYYLLILFPIIVLLNFVKSIKHLSIASTFANLLQVVGITIIVYHLVSDIPPVRERTKLVGTKLPLFFSTTVFSFEAIKVVSNSILSFKSYLISSLQCYNALTRKFSQNQLMPLLK
jgi:amino acid permease